MSPSSQGVPETSFPGFLRSRRARMTPEQAGLSPQSGMRRVPGLRREEVARLAGVSIDYYIQLERGGGAGVSASVLEALARALQLNDTERGHLFALAHSAQQRPRPRAPQRPRPGLLRVVETLTDVPAFLLGYRLDILATNRLAQALHVGLDELPADERNMVRYVFLHDAARTLYADWAETAREVVGALRLHASHHPHDPQLAQLVGELSEVDRDFRRWWAEHDVYRPQCGSTRYNHPLVGELTLDYEALNAPDDPHQALVLSTANPGSPSEKALRLLAELRP
ncbi:helix-turn-helix transcriptional regulator [Streptomyces sp. NPDC059718]